VTAARPTADERRVIAAAGFLGAVRLRNGDRGRRPMIAAIYARKRHGFAGAPRALGVWGPCRGPSPAGLEERVPAAALSRRALRALWPTLGV